MRLLVKAKCAMCGNQWVVKVDPKDKGKVLRCKKCRSRDVI